MITKYTSPKFDIAFKKLFASQKDSALTISFLNAVLENEPGNRIVSLQIMDPTNLPDRDGLRMSFVDVKCTDERGNKYIIEMQQSDQPYFFKRALFYSGKGLIEQLKPKEDYNLLVPVIFVGVLNFNFFANESDCVTHHGIVNLKTKKISSDHMAFHFIELKKFTKTIEEVETELDKWIYLLKEAEELNEIPCQMNDSEEIKRALQLLEINRWTRQEQEIYDQEIDNARQIRSSFEIAEKRGEAKGEAKGKAEGKAEGEAKGKMEEKMEIAKNLLAINIDLKTISTATGLDIDSIKKLK